MTTKQVPMVGMSCAHSDVLDWDFVGLGLEGL